MTDIGHDRLLRVCDLCGGVDDHPRHVLAGGTPQVFARPGEDVINAVMGAAPVAERARLLADLLDTSSSDRHMDCCRQAGCPSCETQTAGAEHMRGADLLDHLMAKAD